MIRNYTYILALGAAVAACTPAPQEAYFNRGEPESLLDISTEVVNVKITSPASVQKIVDVINKEQPTRARVSCQDSDPLCKEVKSVMNQFGVAVKYKSSNANNVALVYERIMARNCQNRYIDNISNNYNNLNYPTLGCSIAANMVQMVSDKHQFTNPALMDDSSATKLLQAITNYNAVAKPDTSFSTMVEGGGGGSSGGSR